MESLSEWLISEMEKRGWSQNELAKRSGINQVTISRIINGGRNPGPDFCIAVARALKIPPEEVFRRAGLLPPVAEDATLTQQIMDLIKYLPPDEQRKISVQIRAIYEDYFFVASQI